MRWRLNLMADCVLPCLDLQFRVGGSSDYWHLVCRDQLQQLRSTLRIAELRQRAVQERVAAKEAEDARLEVLSGPPARSSLDIWCVHWW